MASLVDVSQWSQNLNSDAQAFWDQSTGFAEEWHLEMITNVRLEDEWGKLLLKPFLSSSPWPSLTYPRYLTQLPTAKLLALNRLEREGTERLWWHEDGPYSYVTSIMEYILKPTTD